MFDALQVLTILFAAIGMALALAHALEFPGKRRLDREAYLKVQAIYPPGFTIGGVFEPVAMIAAFALFLFTPFARCRSGPRWRHSPACWWHTRSTGRSPIR